DQLFPEQAFKGEHGRGVSPLLPVLTENRFDTLRRVQGERKTSMFPEEHSAHAELVEACRGLSSAACQSVATFGTLETATPPLTDRPETPSTTRPSVRPNGAR